jgi:hypothetical protein
MTVAYEVMLKRISPTLPLASRITERMIFQCIYTLHVDEMLNVTLSTTSSSTMIIIRGHPLCSIWKTEGRRWHILMLLSHFLLYTMRHVYIYNLTLTASNVLPLATHTELLNARVDIMILALGLQLTSTGVTTSHQSTMMLSVRVYILHVHGFKGLPANHSIGFSVTKNHNWNDCPFHQATMMPSI